MSYSTVKATAEELATWAHKHPSRPTPSVDRVECDGCGKRIWGSGLARGSHAKACRRFSDEVRARAHFQGWHVYGGELSDTGRTILANADVAEGTKAARTLSRQMANALRTHVSSPTGVLVGQRRTLEALHRRGLVEKVGYGPRINGARTIYQINTVGREAIAAIDAKH